MTNTTEAIVTTRYQTKTLIPIAALMPQKSNTIAIPFKPLHNNHPHNVVGLEKKISSLLINHLYSNTILMAKIQHERIVTSDNEKSKRYFSLNEQHHKPTKF